MLGQLLLGLLCLVLAVTLGYRHGWQVVFILGLAWASGWSMAFYLATRDLLERR